MERKDLRRRRLRDEVGSYLRDLERYRLIEHEEAVALGRRARAGDAEARRRLIEANLKLVIAIVKRYRNRTRYLTTGDLIGEGNLGLIDAVERWDPERGLRFSTYACWWILQRIRRAILNNSRIVRLPDYVCDIVRRDRLGLEQVVRSKIPLDVMRRAFASEDVSLDAFSEVYEAGDRSEALHAPDLVASLRKQEEAREELAAITGYLTFRERDIVRRRFGIDCEEETLERVGARHGISREYVRQLEERAIEKLKIAKRKQQHAWNRRRPRAKRRKRRT